MQLNHKEILLVERAKTMSPGEVEPWLLDVQELELVRAACVLMEGVRAMAATTLAAVADHEGKLEDLQHELEQLRGEIDAAPDTEITLKAALASGSL